MHGKPINRSLRVKVAKLTSLPSSLGKSYKISFMSWANIIKLVNRFPISQMLRMKYSTFKKARKC